MAEHLLNILTIYLSLILRTALMCSISYFYLYKKKHKFKKFNSNYIDKKTLKKEILLTFKNTLHFLSFTFVIYYLFLKKKLLIYNDISDYGLVYFLFSFFLIAFLQDLYFFICHLYMHSKYGKWVKHSVHHVFKNPTPFSSYAMSTSEFYIQHLFYVFILIFIPIHTYIIILYIIFSFFSNIIGHCGFKLWENKITFLSSSKFHYDHHKYYNFNFSLYFTYLDKLFKLEKLPKQESK